MSAYQEATDKTHYFLQGGGEMGALTRAFDWSKTSLGTPDQWPQSLRTSVSIVLNSAFPMFLLWEKDLLCFYNDAFRPSLGIDGKHPAIGKKATEVWAEIWEFIGPLLSQVMTTENAVWFEDQLVPFYRNGKMEEIYWTFSYSPVREEHGNIGGVLVVCTETTGKIKAVQRLEESKEQLEFALEAAELGTWDLNPVTNKFTGNDRLKEWFGLPPKAEIELPLAIAVILEKDRRRVSEAIQHSLQYASGGHYDIEYTILATGKEPRIVRAKGRAWFNDKKEAYRFNGTLQDVTKQAKDLQALETSEAQIRSVVESAPFPIAVYVGREMRISLANQAIMDIWGKGDDVIGKLFTDILPELNNQEVFEQLDEVFTSGTPLHIKNQRLDIIVKGKPYAYYFNYSFTPLYDASGHIYGVMNTGVDITDLNQATQKVKDSERNLRNTILQAPVAMCIFKGPSHVLELGNDRIFELWGKPAEELMNRPIFEALPEARDQGFEALLDGVYNTGRSFSASGLPITLPRDGKLELVYINFLYEAYREPDGTISGVMAVATDVTAQVLAHQKIEEVVAERTHELAEANQNLQKSNAELAQFAYIASHDLQEPLRKISTFTQMLEHSLGQVDDRSKNYLDKVTSASVRMTTLIKDVLTYSQLSKDSEVFKPVNLNEVVEDIKTDFELLVEQKEAVIRSENLPAIEAIPLQMSQLFGNLISNALKFSRPGVKPLISISARLMDTEEVRKAIPGATTQYYHIEFSDNGIGFKEEYAEKIFNIFQRLHGKTEYAGTGIGLAMCKKIVQNHHGDIYAASNGGGGAVFHVILPAKQLKNS